MNQDFPPLKIPQPRFEQRRKEKPRFVPIAPELLARRAEIAGRLREQITPLSDNLRAMGDAQRRAVFYKLEHDGPIPLGGTGLRPVAEPSERYTLAVPVDQDLSRLAEKINAFETTAPRKGSVPNSRLATTLQVIQPGESKDRLSQELLENYDSLIEQDRVICEIELLSLQTGNNQRRDELQNFRDALQTELTRDKGIGALFEHEEIKGTVRAVIRCTGALFKKLVEDIQWQRRIYWFEARPEFQTFNSIVENFSFNSLGATTPPSETAPVVCIIDSGVTAGNPFLQPVVREDLLKSFLKTAPNNPSDDFGHGSGVASLAAYYALNPTPGAENEGKVWIASARILTGENQLEDERLFSSLLREVIQYFVPKGVKIFNLSVNVRNLSWNKNAKRTHPRRSWVARTIDQLSREYDVVFVTSTGNILPPDVRDYHRDGKPYPAYFHEEESCILDPGQAALALTVGSVAPATLAEGPTARARTIAERNQASPFTRCGPGIRDEVKPELMDFGGNYLIDEESGIVRSNRGLGLAVASNKLTPALQYQSGTSLAAPRAAHKLALILRDLNALEIVPSASLLKAFAVNSARYSLDAEELTVFQETIGSGHWLNIIGYGIPDDLRATYCDPHSVVSYYQGEIEPGKIAFIDVPVPENLRSAERGTKRLTVTLVYSPEVQRWGLERYLATSFKWRVFRGDASRDDVIAAMSLGETEDVAEPAAETDDPVEESSDPKELPFLLGINRRSKGAAQHDVAQWVVHKPEFSAHNYTLAVTAYERWGRTTASPVPFAVVVRLEETTRSAEIYGEVENAFVQLEVQATSRR